MSFSSSNNLYGFPQPFSRVFPAPIIAQRAPTTADISYPIGQSWIDEVGNDAYVLVDVTAGSGTWVVSAASAGEIATLTASSGGAISPSAGNVNLLGTANQITTAGSGSTITWTLPAAIIAPGSIVATTTIASTTTLTAGSSLSVTTSAVIGTTLTATGGLTTLAALTQAGTASINASGSAVTTIGTGGTGAVNIGNATGNTAVTGSLTASTTLTATLGAITATAGNFVAVAAASGLVLPVTTASGAAGTVICNGRVGTVTFTGPSIAAAADQTLTVTNSAISGSGTRVMYFMRGTQTGAAITVKSVTNGSGTSAIVVTNGTGATTQTGDITFDFIVLN